jgi:cytochrome P450
MGFAAELNAWVFTSYADVAAALRHPGLTLSGAPEPDLPEPAKAGIAAEQFSPPRVQSWRTDMDRSARAFADSLPRGQPVDLLQAFATPWSLKLALSAVGAPAEEAGRLSRLAGEVFRAAAEAQGPGSDSYDLVAAAELARRLPPSALAVQGFVALSHTLPALLGSAWLALIRHPAETAVLRADPALMPGAVEELLRFASPSRAVFRRVVDDLTIGQSRLARGDRVILMLAAANRDPAHFSDPDHLDFTRSPIHLAFGRGVHSCAGAQAIRQAVASATTALLAQPVNIELAGEVTWMGGFAIRAPSSLPVLLRPPT